MITEEDISISSEPVEDSPHIEFRASLHLDHYIRITYSKLNRTPLTEEYIKERLKRSVLDKIYGDIRKQAVDAYVEIRQRLYRTYYCNFDTDPKEILDKAFGPLINAGLTKNEP